MSLRTFRRHPLRIIGRCVWLGWEFTVATLDYVWNITLHRPKSLRAARAQWLQRNSRRVLRVVRVNWRVSGPIPKRGLLISNHLSYLDILVLVAITPAVFVSKREVKNWPVFGWFARLAGTLFINREKRSDVSRSKTEIEQALNDGALVILFPEGTSSNGETVLPFKTALLEPATKSEHELFVGCIRYALEDGDVVEEVCYWRDMTLVPHLINLLGKRTVHASVQFAQIHERSANRKELAQHLRAEVLKLKEGIKNAAN